MSNQYFENNKDLISEPKEITYYYRGKTINLTISIGATNSKDYDSLDDAVSIADDNLYKAKRTGRNKTIG